ncbi:Serine-threonine protein kinase [Komagataella phaffii CBS 7435]|uniref:Serine-threonine protein kinase that is part of a glucose-sensing system n=2 Tax=Komagataella phaffii TaxID=460519 RepID=C4R2V0_KOMPG|nr:Serine-threonine protein kinase that is part of a glucose-sensing system [Komagataella phaffii GS115]AOA61862.1 GQ67_01244T0 [Komagataella phaffii]CAH2447619.1 Serine-threonine protein kinase [Komagataella phaffii CBS 7435]AOA66999.1 GQ68_00146T0 [Komagataella phaffii GS115]CAY69824.1 Serine-threonine protein kinase that is part of a glucose-sensing system [Komagataella phaffii GS115]CCA37805.1 Serine-threonine protein kinase [Komagataella phaffii CBS 7435]
MSFNDRQGWKQRAQSSNQGDPAFKNVFSVCSTGSYNIPNNGSQIPVRGFQELDLSPSFKRNDQWFDSPSRRESNIAQQNLSLLQNGSRPSFSQQLPTTYEHEGMGPPAEEVVLPPPRAAAPGPMQSHLNMQEEQFKEYQRRQSVAVSGSHYQTPPGAVTKTTKLPVPRMRRIRALSDFHPVRNAKPKYRRASSASQYISPLIALSISLSSTYRICRPEFSYNIAKNPRRVLTKPSEPKLNNGYDNIDSDYIQYVHDVLGIEENKKYMVLDILGQGTFGQVVKCQNLKTQEIVAVKVIKSKAAFLNQSMIEAEILDHLNKNIDPQDVHHFLRLKDKFIHRNHLCLVFELLSSNLYELIKQNKFQGLSIKLVRKFAIQLLDSLCVLKNAKLVHCDLKPENILLVYPDKPQLKIIDFGTACYEGQPVYTYIQSRFYRSPEVVLGLSYSTSIDMWSFGCIVAELFLGLPLFPGTSEYNLLARVIDMLGMPPHFMIEMGKNSPNYFTRINSTQYKFKNVEQFSQDPDVWKRERESKSYFTHRYLNEIILNYELPKKNMTYSMIDKEMRQRECLVHFLMGVLNLNPLKRWSPQQASAHPFITGQPFNSNWTPPGFSVHNSGGSETELHSSEKTQETQPEPSTYSNTPVSQAYRSSFTKQERPPQQHQYSYGYASSQAIPPKEVPKSKLQQYTSNYSVSSGSSSSKSSSMAGSITGEDIETDTGQTMFKQGYSIQKASDKK